MPLPKIATPTYELVLPSTKKKIKYRPFLVKEEKLLILALDSRDPKQITTALKNVIQSCTLTRGIKVEQLPIFDIEYLFLRMRSKSVGEEVEVNIIAPDDGVTEIPVKIDLQDVEVIEHEDHDRHVKINDELMMEMRYPSMDQFINNFPHQNFEDDDYSSEKEVSLDQSFELIAKCVDKIYSEEEVWSSDDVGQDEMIEFLGQMNSTHFKGVEKFFETMPKLSYKVDVVNPKTKAKSSVVLEGLSSFFG